MSLRRSWRNISPVLWFLDRLDKRQKLLLKELLHQIGTALDKLVQKLVSCLSALVLRSLRFFLVISGTDLLLDHNWTAVVLVLQALVVRSEQEVLKDLTNEIFLANDSVTDSFVSFCNDLSG